MEKAVIISRDISIILLVLEWLIIGAIPLFVLLKITQGLRRLLPQTRPFLQLAHERLRMVLGYVERAVLVLRKPFDWLESVQMRISRFLSRS